MAIIFDEKGKIFFLITENSEYQMKVDEYGILSSAVEIPADKDEDTVSCESERIYSGYALMNGGYAFNPLYGVYPAVQVHFKRI